ncbi:hypothetical protein Q7P37_003957 [Cladosporium fusiforme]
MLSKLASKQAGRQHASVCDKQAQSSKHITSRLIAQHPHYHPANGTNKSALTPDDTSNNAPAHSQRLRQSTTNMASATIAEEYRSLSRQPPTDPDIQATLSDFLTYTEHFPSHVTRALALIEQQTAKAERKIANIHRDTTLYALLPTLARDARPDPVELRKNISYALEEAERACRMRVEEAVRLEDMAKREADRLDHVVGKLKEQPMPPSRDPTPAAEEQRPLTSPNLKRESRLGIRSDEIKVAEKSSKRFLTDKAASKLRGRKIMVPGEVLPPPDPNAPVESMSDWTSPRVSPPVEEAPARTLKPTTPRPRSRTPKPPKQDKDKDKDRVDKDKDKIEKSPRTPKSRGPRQPGQPGTNAHSALAGISTSNALLALKPPPDDAVKGSKWMPWMRLTEWEMAKLRKRMKKNAIWVPSLTMVRRELKNLGRGAGYRDSAKVAAEAAGEPFVDEPGDTDPTKVEVSGDEQATITAMLGNTTYTDQDEDADAELINRGMRLNEAKKLKRARMLEEQKEAAAQLAREQGTEAPELDVKSPSDAKKRKRESTPARTTLEATLETPDPLSKTGPPPKKLKISLPTAPASIAGSKIPLAPAGVSASPKASAARRAATPPVSKRPSLILKASKAVSEEPPNRRTSLRRGSNGSVPIGDEEPSASTSKAPSRRSKRPAPGVITNGDNESAKVGVSKRKSAPKKKAAASKPQTPTTASMPPAPEEEQELIDPLEPRYCMCGDVSWGTMIACDNEENCEKEWFHLSCIGLDDLPPRRTKWYCPDCRKKLKLGVATNGLVGRMVNATGAGATR